METEAIQNQTQEKIRTNELPPDLSGGSHNKNQKCIPKKIELSLDFELHSDLPEGLNNENEFILISQIHIFQSTPLPHPQMIFCYGVSPDSLCIP